jgi:competence protein ComEA
MTTPPPVPAVAPSGFPDRRKSRAVVGTFLVVMLGLMAFRAYSPHLRARPTEAVSLSPRPVNLNTADRAELLQVPGVGPERADAILAHRSATGPFGTVDDLGAVWGIGGKTLDKVRPFVVVGDEQPVERLERKSVPPPAPVSAGKIKPGEPPINVNAASVSELQRLPGVGPVLAQRIIECREENPFATVEDLRRVPRIGVKTLDALRKFVTVGPP